MKEGGRRKREILEWIQKNGREKYTAKIGKSLEMSQESLCIATDSSTAPFANTTSLPKKRTKRINYLFLSFLRGVVLFALNQATPSYTAINKESIRKFLGEGCQQMCIHQLDVQYYVHITYKVERKNILQYSYSNSSVENVKGTFLVLVRSCMIVNEDSLRKKM